MWSALLLVVGELLLRASGLLFMASVERRSDLSDRADTRTVLCLGDSMTAFGGRHAYPRQLEARLNKRLGPGSFKVLNASRPAVDTGALLEIMEQQLDRSQPDIITVMIGINDELGQFGDLYNPSRASGLRGLGSKLKLVRLVLFGVERVQRQSAERAAAAALEEERIRLVSLVQEGGTEDDWHKLLQVYRQQRSLPDAIRLLRRMAEAHPSPRVLADVAKFNRDPREKERLYHQALERYPDSHYVYKWLVRHYGHQGEQASVETVLRQQAAAMPDVLSYNELAKFLMAAGEIEEAERCLRKALAVEPNFQSWYELGVLYQEQGSLAQAEAFLRRAIEIGAPGFVHARLGQVLRKLGRDKEAEQAYLRAIASSWDRPLVKEYTWDNHDHDRNEAIVQLSELYRDRGAARRAEKTLEDLSFGRESYQDYQNLARRALKASGRLVVVQYPMRSIEPLHVILPEQPGLVFVDNEASFQQAVEEDGYSTMFIDHSGADFGHLTRKGHAMVAENIANAIMAAFCQRSGEGQ